LAAWQLGSLAAWQLGSITTFGFRHYKGIKNWIANENEGARIPGKGSNRLESRVTRLSEFLPVGRLFTPEVF
jgi:hypothetical protein